MDSTARKKTSNGTQDPTGELVKEILHRVKNNFQTIASLLNLQAGYIRDEQARELFKNSRERVYVMALAHEKLYQSRDLSHIEIGEYIRSLVSHLFDTYYPQTGRVREKMEIEAVVMEIETAIPVGLIINELVSNSLKHAFPNRAGEIRIDLAESKDEDYDYTLTVRDNGIGLPAGFDFRGSGTLGMVLVCTLVKQLHGVIDLDSENGTAFTIKFKRLIYKKKVAPA